MYRMNTVGIGLGLLYVRGVFRNQMRNINPCGLTIIDHFPIPDNYNEQLFDKKVNIKREPGENGYWG